MANVTIPQFNWPGISAAAASNPQQLAAQLNQYLKGLQTTIQLLIANQGSGGGGGGAVNSVFGRTGTVVAAPGDYSVAMVTGAAPLASPALTGDPTAPTAAPGTNTTQVATTAYVVASQFPGYIVAGPPGVTFIGDARGEPILI